MHQPQRPGSHTRLFFIEDSVQTEAGKHTLPAGTEADTSGRTQTLSARLPPFGRRGISV